MRSLALVPGVLALACDGGLTVHDRRSRVQLSPAGDHGATVK